MTLSRGRITIIPKKFIGETAIIAGTGPSLNEEDIEYCNKARGDGKARIFCANRAHELFDADVLFAINSLFYETFWERIKDKTCDKWVTDFSSQNHPAVDLSQYPGVKYTGIKFGPGFSTDPSYAHAHHGTGPMLLNIAYLYGCTRLILIGWDMRFHGEKRRYLGEDVLTKRQWPKTGPNGERTFLISQLKSINPEKYGIEIINCTPGSALRHFLMKPLRECL